ncbi:probable cytochrome P450 6a14 [Toxorhynchites rutilus septentrionalis]|uniref:probable cytochrome P450 6a14 n=1 Tax=Toxorhynchites rutilus septentrionalis TaxID=329112 RepID=UPI00247998C2|nr:probable cytochrome P450 6a14 [Toxorhynchites rutilus septentrionalis]
MEWLCVFITSLVVPAVIVYYFLRRQQRLWPNLGIPTAPNPHILFGNVRGIARTEHSYSILQRLYYEFKQRNVPVGGFMNFFQPAILVVDPEVAKCVLVKDFFEFHNRGIFVDTVGDPLSGGLFSLEDTQWKVMRQKMTPTFTSGKMKYMFGTVLKVAQELRQFVSDNCHRDDLEIKDLLQRFTMDVIGNVAFGIECNTLKNPNSQFSIMGNKSFYVDTVRMIKFFVGGQYKTLARKIGIKVVPDDVAHLFLELAKNTVQLRENGGENRNDFMNFLLEIKNKGKLSNEPNSGGDGLTIEEIAAQCFIFFTAGFETSSSTMNFCLYELAMDPDLQEALRTEVVESLAKNNGELTYETLLGMDLLDRTVSETLRKHPPLDNLFRISNARYTIPGTKYTVPENTLFQIPIYAMHNDPEYFPEPDRFDPDRFLPEAVKSRHPYAYLPFGEGPRNCIGMRFGLMQTKIGLVTLLNNFRFTPNSLTPKKLGYSPTSFVLSPRSRICLRIESLNS